jgi:hypothetical protein
MEKIIITLNSATGEINFDSSGFKGKTCVETIDSLIESIGAEKSKEIKKDEYRYQSERVTEVRG